MPARCGRPSRARAGGVRAALRRAARARATRGRRDDDWVGRAPGALNRDHLQSPEAMRRAYADWTERARGFLRERGARHAPRGRGVPAWSRRPLPAPGAGGGVVREPAPASRPPGAATSSSPFRPTAPRPRRSSSGFENNSHAGIPTTAVHEAYPGHHWHLVTMKAHPSPLRLTFRTPYFSEGWALYAEHMMREQGFFEDPRHELYQVEAMLFRAARIVVDTSLHAGDMTLAEAQRFMERAGESDGADGPGRGRALRRVAHPSVGLPGRLSRDPRDPRAPPGRRRRDRRGRAPRFPRSAGRQRRPPARPGGARPLPERLTAREACTLAGREGPASTVHSTARVGNVADVKA